MRVVLKAKANRTKFFADLAIALGIGSVLSRSTSKLELRVCEVLRRRHLLLIVEELHHAFPTCKRPTAQPDLPDFLYGLIDEGVTIALTATPVINDRVRYAEAKTGWNSWQWRRRIRRWVELPDSPTRQDLELVTIKLLPEADTGMRKTIVGFAGRVSEQLDAVVDLVAEARAAALNAGRETVIARDVLAALQEVTTCYQSKGGVRKATPSQPKPTTQDEADAEASETEVALPADRRPHSGSTVAARRHEPFSLVTDD